MICIFLKERMRNAKNFNARKVLEVAFQNAKEKTLKPSISKSGTWSHRMSEWMILINPAQPLQTENGRVDVKAEKHFKNILSEVTRLWGVSDS